jgi:hypothetical protein
VKREAETSEIGRRLEAAHRLAASAAGEMALTLARRKMPKVGAGAIVKEWAERLGQAAKVLGEVEALLGETVRAVTAEAKEPVDGRQEAVG